MTLRRLGIRSVAAPAMAELLLIVFVIIMRPSPQEQKACTNKYWSKLKQSSSPAPRSLMPLQVAYVRDIKGPEKLKSIRKSDHMTRRSNLYGYPGFVDIVLPQGGSRTGKGQKRGTSRSLARTRSRSVAMEGSSFEGAMNLWKRGLAKTQLRYTASTPT
ncbi:hypothetical protein HHK36_003981 [Tetracentron sinense]|uniref:Uncharacterized protein n=1 Tax=Tetracentron sinense TaxID=13715 RepID=A0A834ZS30_TETSI|nr:hypothetical protein HHK36_003981 [Tetracentron sinense]